MAEVCVAGNSVQSPIVFYTGKTARPLKPGQANAFKAKAGQHYRITKGPAGTEQLLDNVVVKRAGDDLQLNDADGTQVTLELLRRVQGGCV